MDKFLTSIHDPELSTVLASIYDWHSAFPGTFLKENIFPSVLFTAPCSSLIHGLPGAFFPEMQNQRSN